MSPSKRQADLVVLRPLVSPLAGDRNRFSPAVVICPLELGAEELDDVCYALKEDAFYPLVQLSYPVVEIRITFQVQPVDLYEGMRKSGVFSKCINILLSGSC